MYHKKNSIYLHNNRINGVNKEFQASNKIKMNSRLSHQIKLIFGMFQRVTGHPESRGSNDVIGVARERVFHFHLHACPTFFEKIDELRGAILHQAVHYFQLVGGEGGAERRSHFVPHLSPLNAQKFEDRCECRFCAITSHKK